jgi:hypothetical protein
MDKIMDSGSIDRGSIPLRGTRSKRVMIKYSQGPLLHVGGRQQQEDLRFGSGHCIVVIAARNIEKKES